MPTKPAFASLGVWGIILTYFCIYFPKIAGSLHLTDPATVTALGSFLTGVGAFFTLGMALYGRLNATQAISGLFKSKPTRTTGNGSPPAAANLFAIMVVAGLLIAPVLSACSTTGTVTAASTASQVLGSVTAAVNAHPAATAAGRLDAERAFTVAAGGVEAAYQAGLLNAATVKTAKADLETARSVLLAARAAFVLTGTPSSADLVAAQAASDAAFARVDAELVTS